MNCLLKSACFLLSNHSMQVSEYRCDGCEVGWMRLRAFFVFAKLNRTIRVPDSREASYISRVGQNHIYMVYIR